ncbi:hypothetical protein [Pedobacter nutrimenti]|uniref:hypothetical protein n=1 Tax=Pedobacter nutrimenti TaxID=1241337 RepID=UPI002930D4ED|nr:hypothetical protein [Pedobacter nutrimenti]
MKKLSLNTSAFHKGEVLTRSQLKKVLGGDGSGGGSGVTCHVTIKEGCFGYPGPGPTYTGASAAAAQTWCSTQPCCGSISC